MIKCGAVAMEKQLFRSVTMDKQQGPSNRALERHQSFSGLERPRTIRFGGMEKQKSFRIGLMEKQQSFREKKNKGVSQKRGDSPLHLASRAGNLLQVREILSGGAYSGHLNDLISAQNNDGETPLYVAAENGQLEVVHEILKQSDAQSASLKAKNGLDAFHIAAKQGHVGKPSVAL